MIFALISTLLVIWIVMWIFFKFMYPKPPKAFFPKEGDVTTPRICDFCGHELAQYRGIVEKKKQQVEASSAEFTQPADSTATTPAKSDMVAASEDIQNEWFFCNAEHQASFHAGESYQS